MGFGRSALLCIFVGHEMQAGACRRPGCKATVTLSEQARVGVAQETHVAWLMVQADPALRERLFDFEFERADIAPMIAAVTGLGHEGVLAAMDKLGEPSGRPA